MLAILGNHEFFRGLPSSLLNGRIFAARGYHVVIQSVRGTFGSGGTFRPMAQETFDGPAAEEGFRLDRRREQQVRR